VLPAGSICTLNCPIIGIMCANDVTPVTGIDSRGCPTCPLCPSGEVSSPLPQGGNGGSTGGGVQPVLNPPSINVNPSTVQHTPPPAAGGGVGPIQPVLPGGSICALNCPIIELKCANGAIPVTGIDARGCPTCLQCLNGEVSSPSTGGGVQPVINPPAVSINPPPPPPPATNNGNCPSLSNCPADILCAPGGTVVKTPLVRADGCQLCPEQYCLYPNGVGHETSTQHHTTAKPTTTTHHNGHHTTTTKQTTARTTAKPVPQSTPSSVQPIVAPPVFVAPTTPPTVPRCATQTCTRQPPTCYAPQTLVTLHNVDATTGCPTCPSYACSCQPIADCPALSSGNCVRPNGGWMSQMACNCMPALCTETATVQIRASAGTSTDQCSAMTSQATSASCTCSATSSALLFSVTCIGAQQQSVDSYSALQSSQQFMYSVQSSLESYLSSDQGSVTLSGSAAADNVNAGNNMLSSLLGVFAIAVLL
jgi:hypothetical protein